MLSRYRWHSSDQAHVRFFCTLLDSTVELASFPSRISPLRLTLRADEVDPYQKPQDLLELSPKGLVPALKLHTYTPPRALNESTIILEYLEEYVIRMISSRLFAQISSDP